MNREVVTDPLGKEDLWADLRESAAAVKLGFAQEQLGNTEVPTTIRFRYL